jgi:phenylacetic acid degradation operon negative regulatory protein
MLHSSIVANKARIIGDPRPALRPLSPRSIVLSVLLGSHPPQMPVGRILEFTSLFGLADGAVRTALSRMVAHGDLVNDDGSYRLTDRLIARQAQQDTGRSDPPDDWDGTWWTVAVLADRRTMAERRAFRSEVVGARLGELRPDLWMRPANRELRVDLPEVMITRGPVVAGDERRLIARLWDLNALEAESRSHERALDAAAERLDDPDDRAIADTFVVLAATQRFLRAEPQLPVELAPDTTSAAVRTRYAVVVDRFQHRLARFFAERRAASVGAAASVSTTAR